MAKYTKYRIKYGNTLVDVVHFKPPQSFDNTSEYIKEAKQLADDLQTTKQLITCSPDDYILVHTEQGMMKLLPNEYYVVMSNGKGFIYRALDFLATYQKV